MTRHGGDIYGEELQRLCAASGRELLDFSANLNPLGMPEGVRRAVTESLKRAEHYPDPHARHLRRALAEYHGLPEDFFLCGNGGADLIYRYAYALRPKRALLTAPTFAEYEEALRQAGAECRFYRMEPDYQVREDILDAMEERPDVVFLCNPNNPTGLLIEQTLLMRILERARALGIRLFLDECFLDFTDQPERSLLGRVGDCPELWILRSFTKLYAMPGLRLGYGISSDRELLERMAAAGQCWGVSVPASEAGIAALQEEQYRRDSIALVRREREFLKGTLVGLGFQVWDGQADYLFFRARGMRDLYERLLPYGILIRRCGNYRGLDEECYRIAVKDHPANERLAAALRETAAAGAPGGLTAQDRR